MAIIKNSDIVKMSNKECEEKIQDLRMELMKEGEEAQYQERMRNNT